MDSKTIFASLGFATSLWLLGYLVVKIIKWIDKINDVLYKFESDRCNIYDRLINLERKDNQ